MKSLKLITLIIVNFIISIDHVNCQNSFEIGGKYRFMKENLLTSGGEKVGFNNEIYYSLGLTARKELLLASKIFIDIGAIYRRFGNRFELEDITVQQPDGTSTFFETELDVKAIEIPISIGYYFLNNNKIRVGLAMGFSNSFIFDQKERSKNGIKDETAYVNHHFNIRANIEVGVKIAEKVIINILPVWQKQLNSNFSGSKQRGYGFEIGASYIIN